MGSATSNESLPTSPSPAGLVGLFFSGLDIQQPAFRGREPRSSVHPAGVRVAYTSRA